LKGRRPRNPGRAQGQAQKRELKEYALQIFAQEAYKAQAQKRELKELLPVKMHEKALDKPKRGN